MRKSRLLHRLTTNQPVRLCSLGHFVPSYIRHAAAFGFDCIWLDAEHRAFSEAQLATLLASFHLFDVDCMLRPATLEKTRLYRYLEDGASGLLIPHVSTPEKARFLVDAVKFPPLGDRGLDGAGFDGDFYHDGGENYTEAANRETFLVVQIETPQAVENVDAIAAVDGIDGLFIGPGDLGLRIRRTDTELTLEAAEKAVAAAARAHGKAWGCPAGSVEEVRRLRDLGAKLIAYGGDFTMMMDGLRRRGSELEDVYGTG